MHLNGAVSLFPRSMTGRWRCETGICCAGISVVSYLNRKRLSGDRFYELIVECEPFCLR
jgi:hypothetical protein